MHDYSFKDTLQKPTSYIFRINNANCCVHNSGSNVSIDSNVPILEAGTCDLTTGEYKIHALENVNSMDNSDFELSDGTYNEKDYDKELQKFVSKSVKHCGADKIAPGELLNANFEFDDDDIGLAEVEIVDSTNFQDVITANKQIEWRRRCQFVKPLFTFCETEGEIHKEMLYPVQYFKNLHKTTLN